MKTSIRTKLVYYIFLTVIITFVIFGSWMLQKEKKRWDTHQLGQSLDFATFISPEIVKLFGRNIQSKEVKMPFDNEARKLTRYNKDLIGFMIFNVNSALMYDSERYEDFLDPSERAEIDEIKKELDLETAFGEKLTYRIVTLKSGKKLVDIMNPVVHFTGRHILSVRFLISYNSIEETFIEIKRDFYLSIFVALCFAFLMLVIISNKITNPVFVLTRIVKKMRAGDFNVRVTDPPDDEIGDLSHAFNEMVTAIQDDREAIEGKNKELVNANTELKELQEQLITSERLAAVGLLAAGISHEIDNPIGIILGYAELIKSELSDESTISDELDNIINESKRCRRIVGGLLNFSKTSPSFIEELDLNDVAKEVVNAVSVQSLFKQITIDQDYDHDIPVIKLDRDKVKQVLINLLINAAQAIGGNGEIKVVTRLAKNDGKRVLELYVKDTGVGISDENMEKIFDPFFSTKTRSRGTGLGLSICQKLIEEQKGSIVIESKVDEGTIVTISFPTDQIFDESEAAERVI